MDNKGQQYESDNFLVRNNTRIVIIHRHLFKNAGTTFDAILENNFGASFCDHRDDEPMRKIGPDYLVQYLLNNPEIKALSSHHIWFNMPRHPQLDLVAVMFLRHPIERMRSVYDFERKQKSDTLGAKMAKQLSFRDYVLWYMKDFTPATIRDFHTRHLAGIKTVEQMKKKHLRIAKKEILTNHFIGLVEYFDQSLQLFDRAFKTMGIELEISYQPKNVSRPFKNADYDKRAEEVLKELGNDAKEVLKKNANDLKLYNIAKDNLKKKILQLTEKNEIS